MADKIKPGISVRTTFVAGESPKAAKLNSLSSQLQNASQRLEAVIGDIHSESYPYSSITAAHLSLEYGRTKTVSGPLTGAPTRPLDIATLGRLVGPASNLNPHELASQNLTETVPTAVYEFALNYPPSDPATVTFSDATIFATYRSSVGDLDSSGDYHVNAYGKVFTVGQMNGGTVSYTYDPAAHAGGSTYQDSSFNVIPDINQLEAGSGCSVGALDADGRRAITLPTVTHHHYNSDGTTVVLSAADPTFGQQLYLPKILVDNWSTEEEIPGGFLYLKNYTKNKVYKVATYYYYSNTSILISGEDITDDVDAGDIFCIITVGTDLTTAVDDLRRKLRHSHNRSFGEPLVPVEALTGILSSAGNSGVFAPSEIPGNFFPQYLHRDGYTAGIDDNVNDENVMRGDLVLGTEGALPGAHRTALGASKKFRFFGGNTNSTLPYIYKDSSGGLVLYADQPLNVVPEEFDDADILGVRVRGGYLVPEKGIVSGLNNNMGVTGNGEYPVQMLNLFFSESVDTGLPSHTIDLATYGLDITSQTVINMQFMIGLSSTLFTSSDAAALVNLDYGFEYSQSTGEVTFYMTGSSWAGTQTIYFHILAFYYEDADV